MQSGSTSDAGVPSDVLDGSEPLTNGHSAQPALGDDVPAPPSPPPPPPPPLDASLQNRGTKRKLSDASSPQRAKKPSPPWKRFGVEGVSSFTEGGRRKSSRTNAVPLEVQPSTRRRTTRGDYDRYQGSKARSTTAASESGRSQVKSAALGPSRHGARLGATENQKSTRGSSNSKSSADRPLRTGRDSAYTRRSRHSEAAVENAGEDVVAKGGQSTTSALTSPGGVVRKPRQWFRIGPQAVPIANPAGIPKRKQYASLQDLLAKDDPLDGDDIPRLSASQVAEEAKARHRMVQAGEPGGPLYSACSYDSDDGASDQPFGGFALSDYLAKHAIDLHSRLFRENRDHRAMAKRIAGIAATAARARMPKSDEELLQELQTQTMDAFRRSCLKELKFIFESTTSKIWQLKRHQYDEREAAAGRDRMRRMVDRSEGLLTARKGPRLTSAADERLSIIDSEDDEYSSRPVSERSEGSSSSGSNINDDESSEDDESDDATNENDPDNLLSAKELLDKYQHLPDVQSEASEDPEPLETPSQQPVEDSSDNGIDPFDASSIDPSKHALDEVDDILMEDSSDESGSTATSEDDTAMSDMSSEVEREDVDDEDDEEHDPMLGFFSKSERQRLEEDQDMQHSAHLEAEHDDAKEDPNSSMPDVFEGAPQASSPENAISEQDANSPQLSAPPIASDEPSRQSTPNTVATSKVSRPESMSSVEPSGDKLSLLQHYAENEDAERMTVSPLIRGTLRPYQHAGFDWLARMYHESTNGILADEMGLGKTFQTIALLAHVATHHQIWGPHLVVVPTSVMLNWELEFKKFCPGFKVLTYYGTQEERKQKRKGWMDRDKWHVYITSYQLALQDASSLKRRPWHYLILDEAHNIKNFRSQRWQTLLSFRSEARLLLTGTPLQNNLSELWSLLFFLAPEQDEDGNTGFGSLQEFSKVFHKPVDQILEHGRGVLDDESIGIVNKLHKVLRPHLLRRLKADVEKQMPKKFEHVIVCRLSKRQRQLYDSYMGLAGTRESFASGNYMSIINCLMQLRKVCNHPDLFDTRQIVTSFAMPRSAIVDFEIKELLVRRRLLSDSSSPFETHSGPIQLWARNEYAASRIGSNQMCAAPRFDTLVQKESGEQSIVRAEYQTVDAAISSVNRVLRKWRFDALQGQKVAAQEMLHRRPVFDLGLLDLITRPAQRHPRAARPARGDKNDQAPMLAEHFLPSSLSPMKLSLHERSSSVKHLVQRFGCVTPAVTAPDMSRLALTDTGVKLIEELNDAAVPDPFHEARVRLSIAFPDKGLVQYDCGKLQQLDRLLRRLQTGGHRALIFTQMTKVLDILEQFMNLHGHRYLRLDGATKIEQRQVLTDRFNNDPRILCFILSSRSGGLGINLTGADTVIFYDLDWNPAMDKQCQDRCHRIGQTRDVHIYRFVSEGTIEANILRKSNQKRMLDDVVIQEGDFTTDYLNKMDFDDGDAEANAALDKVLGGGSASNGRVLGQVEDREDQEAARVAQKEDNQTDAADFEDRPGVSTGGALQIGTPTKASPDLSSTPVTSPTPSSTHAETSTAEQAPDSHAAKSQDLGTEQRQQLYEQFAALGLPQDKPILQWKHDEDGDIITDEHGNPAELPGFDDYIRRLFEWEMRDLAWAPPKDSKKGKKGKTTGGWGKIRR